jgi:triacylglycerol esterase/lipase EstA (alpha/beta hydrolase family)
MTTTAALRRAPAGVLALVTACAVLFGALTSANAALPVGGLGDGLWAFAVAPKTVAGANDWTCKPSAAHPRPVVLVHGTFENMGFNWTTLSPQLKNAGYCVFALNYGANLASLDQRFGGLADIPASAGELSVFVNKVLSSTGTTKVDIVGHSQGGMMPNYYLKRLGGASKVNTLIGLAPSNHGTTLSGIVGLGQTLGLLSGFNTVAMMGAPSLAQQEVGSPFITSLFADGDTVAGPRYVVIETTKDAVVTPYTNAFLRGPNVKNITIQDQCPQDGTGHVGMVNDSPTMQNVLNQLGPNSATFKPTCSGYGIGV